MRKSNQRRSSSETLDIKVIDPQLLGRAGATSLQKRLLSCLGFALPALALAQIWHHVVCQNLAISTLSWSALVIQALLLLGILGWTLFGWRGKLLTGGLGLVFTGLLVLMPELFGERATLVMTHLGQQLQDSGLWLGHALGLLSERPEAAPVLLSPLILILLSLLSYSLFRFSAPRLLLLAFITSFFYLTDFKEGIGRSQILLFAGLFCIGLAFLFARQTLRPQTAVVQAPPLVPVALILLLLVLLYQALPPFALQNQKLYDHLEFIRERFKREEKLPDTINYYEFSLKDLGYYPQQNRLGGPVNILEKPYMRYEGPSQPTYLSGTVYGEFALNHWVPSPMDPNFIFRSEEPGREQRRAFFLDEKTYPVEIRQKFFDLAEATIWPIEQPVQVIFNPSRLMRLDQVSPPVDDESQLRFFFNRSGQIYASLVLPETGYRFHAAFPRPLDASELEQKLRATLGEDLDLKPSQRYQEIMKELDPGLAKIVYAEGGTDLDQLGRLFMAQDYLSRHYRYTLQPPVPGDNEDFFVHFLSQKEGYCTYFATAMTLIAREMGFEAQYVEGLLVKGVSDLGLGRYERVVKNTSAHAWTRLDLPMVGGIILDAVPREALANLSRDQEREIDPPPPPEESQPETTPPTNPPESSESQLPESQPSESEPPSPDLKAESLHLSPWLWALLAIFLVISALVLFVALRMRNSRRRHDLDYLIKRYGEEESVQRVWRDLHELYRLFTGAKLPPQTTVLTAYRSFAQSFREIESGLAGQAFLALEQAFYGPEPIHEEKLSQIMAYYGEVESLYQARTSRLKYFWYRILTGARA